MQKQNIGEYEFIRKELSDLRNCITTYMGFVIGGSGVAFFGATALTETKNLSGNTIALAFFISSIIVSLVLMILYYKFNSYNRYAGYCKLLNQEKYESQIEVEQFISWEVCLDILREADYNLNLLLKKAESVKVETSENVKAKIKSIYKTKWFLIRIIKGIWLLTKTLIGRGKTKSWKFPLYVVSVFFVINLLHLAFGLHFYFSFPSEKVTILLSITVYSILTIQIFAWSHFFIKLYELMEGKSTIESFCWRFLPIRYEYIKKQSPDIHYDLITLK